MEEAGAGEAGAAEAGAGEGGVASPTRSVGCTDGTLTGKGVSSAADDSTRGCDGVMPSTSTALVAGSGLLVGGSAAGLETGIDAEAFAIADFAETDWGASSRAIATFIFAGEGSSAGFAGGGGAAATDFTAFAATFCAGFSTPFCDCFGVVDDDLLVSRVSFLRPALPLLDFTSTLDF